MIEKKIVAEKLKEFEIQEFIANSLKNVGHSHTKLQKTPLGEKIIIYTSRPGLIVGRKGQNIKKLTKELKERFKLENPQIEVSEVESPDLDPNIVADRIAVSLEKYGTSRFKAIGYRELQNVMNAGALGVEIRISGKVPSARAKSWRFYSGYLKKCGNLAITGVRKATKSATLKSGIVGINVSIMPPDIELPDDIKIKSEEKQEGEKGKKDEGETKKGKEEIEIKEEKASEKEIKDENKNKKRENKGKKSRTRKVKETKEKKKKKGEK